MDETVAPPRHPRLARAVALVGHPLLLAGALGLWWALGATDDAVLPVLAAALASSITLERLVPAMPGWRLGVGAHLRLGGVYLLGLLLSGLMIAGYESLLPDALAPLRARIGAVLWPGSWPTLVQALLLFFASDLIYYWAHRAIHRWAPVWRMTGHGFHHAFQNLHAINTGTNHPFELVLLTLPLVLLAALTGAPEAATGAAGILLLTNTTLAHANVRMDTPVFNLFFTGSDQHRRHHSVVFEESNTNYACNAILWDRLFGTFSRGEVRQTGIGPTQPALWRMFLLPFREPQDVDTVSTRSREAG
jgi:sterol desaturase/sphingolipid hydroxylase (fatty acid hydroxylase superfamily)